MATNSQDITFGRHDLSLLVIGFSLLVGALFGLLSGAAVPESLLAGSVPATGCVGYTLFYRPPVDWRKRRR